ncbi:MAG: hypothetical protein E7656_04465 [Ruminococcaceae bacterium]|nr:hypothetical protein [Oscillospiraceae bacterium]
MAEVRKMANNIQKSFRRILKSKKIKFGSVALAFTIMFVVIVLLLNALVSVFDAKKGLYIDTTGEQRYEIGDITIEKLSGITEKIEIVFCADRDILVGNSVMGMIVTLAEKYETTFPNISVRFLDLKRDLKEAKNLSNLAGGENPTETDVIIRAVDSERARLLKYGAFFVSDSTGYSYVGFDGERRFTESILMALNASNDKVVFLTGHRENTNPTKLKEVLAGAGYLDGQIEVIDLLKQEIPENTRLIIINDPALDFHGYESELKGNTNEIKKLDSYLKNNYSNLLVCIDHETKELPALRDYLSTTWGITYQAASSVEDRENASTTGESRIKPVYYKSANGDDYIAQRIVRNLDDYTVVMGSCVPLEPSGKSAGKLVAPVLTTSDNAVVYKGKESVSAKNVPLMMVSTLEAYPVNPATGVQETKFAHVIVSGSTDFIHSDLDETNSNSTLVRNILSLVGTQSVTTDIEPKLFVDNKLETMKENDAKKITLILTFLPAGLVAAAGVAVYVRRKRL